MNIAVKVDAAAEAADAYAIPLAEINPAKVERFQDDTIWPVFERLRREDPVHFTADSEFGPYWSITKWDDIMAVDTDHEAFSSADGIGLANLKAMEEQEARSRRSARSRAAAAAPASSPWTSRSTACTARRSARRWRRPTSPRWPRWCASAPARSSNSLPIGTPFDWVDLVSKELTAMTLATLFDFPFEDRRKLPYWSDMVMNQPGHGPVKSWQHKAEAMMECFGDLRGLWNERVTAEPAATT